MPFHTTASPPEEWITAQQFAYGASLVASLPLGDKRRMFAEDLVQGLTVSLEEDERGYRETLASWPLMTLESLCQIDWNLSEKIETHHGFWRHARSEMLWSQQGKVSPIAGAKLLANLILKGHLKAPQLVRIASLELNSKWPDTSEVYDAINYLTCHLSSARHTHERLRILAQFREAVPYLRKWPLVENCILHQSYFWPLVVHRPRESYDVSVAQNAAFALPIEIHISLNGTGNLTVYPTTNGVIGHADWKKASMRALRAARMLWQDGRSSWDIEYHRIVENTGAVIDLRVAEKIVAPYYSGELKSEEDVVEPDSASLKTGWLKAYKFEDSSLETYLSLAILAQLLGDVPSIETICATGSLARPKKNFIGGDHWVEPALHVAAKAKWASSVGIYDKFITPRFDKSSVKDLPRSGHLAICEVGKVGNVLLSDFAREVMPEFQRHKYLRCPDIAIAFRDPCYDEEEVNKVGELLANNVRSPILRIPASIKAASVAKALYNVNQQVEGVAGSFAKVGAFMFVRATRDENNERFWHVVADCLDISAADFSKVRLSNDPDVPAQILTKALNRFAPEKIQGTYDIRRAPDVVVIVGAKQVSAPGRGIPNSPFERLQLEPLLQKLEESLKPSPIEGIGDRIGKTRIIVIEGDDERFIVDESELDSDVVDCVKYLSVFRHGFTEQAARRMLPPDKLRDWDLLHLLRVLQRVEVGGVPILRYSGRTSTYYMSIQVETSDLAAMAEAHYRAAGAIAEFLHRDGTDARSNFRALIAPDLLHEAEWHLRQARFFYSRVHFQQPTREAQNEYRNLISTVSHELERLSRLGEIFGWSRVRWAAEWSNEDSSDTLDVLRDHLEIRSGDATVGKKDAHPVELLWAARFVWKLACRIRNDATPQSRDKYAALLQEREQYLKEALRACVRYDYLPDGSRTMEGNSCRYAIATTRACMFMVEGNAPLKDAEHFFLDAESAIARDYKAEMALLDEEWFEILGDRVRPMRGLPGWKAHSRASGIYLRGIINTAAGISIKRREGFRPPATNTVVKYFGACALGKQSPSEEVVDYIGRLSPQNRDRIFDNRTNVLLGGVPHVAERYRAGQDQINKILRSERA